MHCPACGTNYGGPTMEACGCCPLCLADTQRFERLVREDDEDTIVPLERRGGAHLAGTSTSAAG